MKKIILVFVLISNYFSAFGQITGSFETYSSWYVDDEKIKLEALEADERLRANSYLKLDYNYKNFTTGFQLESYEPRALLNYSPRFKGTNIGTFYLNYTNKKNTIDVTTGHFYEKFGNGLALRTWEDKPLGIANSLFGAKVKLKPFKAIEITTLYGKQRNGFGTDFSNSKLFGANLDVKLSTLTKAKTATFGWGTSFVNKNEEITDVPSNVYLYSNRFNFKRKGFTIDFEYVFKSEDALVEFGEVRPQFLFDGDALLINMGYSKKGFGFNSSFRRMENFGFYSQTELSRNSFNEALLNYIPSITKQFDYSLTNIYVYQAQPNLRFEPDGNKSGEIGGQFDLFYNFKKGSVLGGKNGLNIALNYSTWYGLKSIYNAEERQYEAEFIGFGQKFYTDYSIEIRKNISKKWTSIVTFLNQYYNAKFVEETVGEVNTNTIVWDNQYNFSGSKTIKIEAQHQWADAGFKNWVGGLIEYNFNTNWSIFNSNLYNYGNSDEAKKINYYTFGTSYSKNATRVQLSYGRQRGGLVCIGGVCRFVPESSGLTLNINYSF